MSRRNSIFLGLLLIALSALVALSVLGGQRETAAQLPYSSSSSGENGTLALFEWLDAIGYRPERRGAMTGGLGEPPAVLIVLPSIETRESRWADDILDWVRAGGTAIVAQDDDGFNPLLRELSVTVTSLTSGGSALDVVTPLPGIDGQPKITFPFVGASLDLERDHAVHLQTNASEKPVLVSFDEGQGKVFATTVLPMLTNDGLREEANARWARALIGDLPRGSRVIFDQTEVSIGFVERPNFNQLLFTSPWGWALLLAAALLALYVIVNGRRFGRVLPLQRELARRDPSEYVVSTAGLFHRANKQALVLRHFHRQIKRKLGRRWQINPKLPDAQFAELLARAREDVKQDELLRLLQSLDLGDTAALNEREVLARARAAAMFLDQYAK
jgi:hypothetical protein